MRNIGDKFWDINDTGYMYEITEILNTHYKLLGTPTNLSDDCKNKTCTIGKETLEEYLSEESSWWVIMNEKNIEELKKIWGTQNQSAETYYDKLKINL